MNIVGLGDQAAKEAKDRIESGFGQLIGLMLESNQIEPMNVDLNEMIFLGEVGCSQIHLP